MLATPAVAACSATHRPAPGAAALPALTACPGAACWVSPEACRKDRPVRFGVRRSCLTDASQWAKPLTAGPPLGAASPPRLPAHLDRGGGDSDAEGDALAPLVVDRENCREATSGVAWGRASSSAVGSTATGAPGPRRVGTVVPVEAGPGDVPCRGAIRRRGGVELAPARRGADEVHRPAGQLGGLGYQHRLGTGFGMALRLGPDKVDVLLGEPHGGALRPPLQAPARRAAESTAGRAAQLGLQVVQADPWPAGVLGERGHVAARMPARPGAFPTGLGRPARPLRIHSQASRAAPRP